MVQSAKIIISSIQRGLYLSFHGQIEPNTALGKAPPPKRGMGGCINGVYFDFGPALARRLQFISTKRNEKGVGANIDNLHKAGLGQGFGNVDCGMLNQPLASPSCRLYEPEAVGAIGAYAPEGAQRAWRIA